MFRCLPLALFCLLSACTNHRPATSPRGPSETASGGGRADMRPVVDTAPYWCDLVPRESMARVSGPEHELVEVRSPENTAEQGICSVKDAGRYGPLGVLWDLKGGRASLASNLRQLAADRPRPLPVRLGSGFVAYSPRTSHLPYESGSLFRCGSHEPWIYIALRTVSAGRDATEDLTALMEVAQRRFGEVHRCVPRPLRGS